MEYSVSQQPYEKDGGEDSGRDSLNFTPAKHYVGAVDAPKGGAGSKEPAQEVQESDSHESAQAQKGARWAVEGGDLQGDGLRFRPSDGCFTSGPSVAAGFESAIRSSGGVRQANAWTSDAAPGVARCVVDHTLTLDDLSKPGEVNTTDLRAGSGRTFESQRRDHWTHDRWGG